MFSASEELEQRQAVPEGELLHHTGYVKSEDTYLIRCHLSRDLKGMTVQALLTPEEERITGYQGQKVQGWK